MLQVSIFLPTIHDQSFSVKRYSYEALAAKTYLYGVSTYFGCKDLSYTLFSQNEAEHSFSEDDNSSRSSHIPGQM